MTTRQHYMNDLKELQHQLLRMGCMMEEAIKGSMEALVEKDLEKAQNIIDGDDKIDEMELKIEDHAVRLLLTQQPVATDLRKVVTALKITTDIERIADHATDIAEVVQEIGEEKHIKKLIDLPRMSNLAIKMVKDSLVAYVENDAEAAREICQRDDVIDALFAQIFRELLMYMMEDPKKVTQATHFLFVARALERIADHATNICEWVVYIETGKIEELN